MKKLIILGCAIALVALFTAPATAAPITTASAECDVTLTIEKYCYIQYTGCIFELVVTGGASGDCQTENFAAGANFEFYLSSTLVPPPGAPGDWTDGMDPVGGPIPPGEVTGTVQVCVENITLADGSGYWDGGTKTITISDMP